MIFDDTMTLALFGDRLDAAGRAWSPFMERGQDDVPSSTRIPQPHELRSPKTPAESAEMDRLTQRFFGAQTPDIEGETRAEYLTRFNITPNDPRWSTEMERLKTSQRGKIQLAHARRVNERYLTLQSAGGDLNAQTVYIAEGDDPCEECVELAGGIMRLGDRIDQGMMPSDKCLGGPFCQCAVEAV